MNKELKTDSYSMKRIALILIILFLSFFTFGQEQGEDGLSPFVSGLTAEVNEMSIVLTWKNPAGVEGKLLIYRHTEEITEKNIGSARLLMVTDMSGNSFIDSPGDLRQYYYAILIQDKTGTIHKDFISYRNKTVTGVYIKEITPEVDAATKITGIKATVRDNTIVITYQSSKPNRYLLLYRSTSPLIDEDSLIQASTPVTLQDFTYTYTDYPIAGIEYYYAVLDAGLVKIGNIQLISGNNSLKKPVMIPLKGDTKSTDPLSKRSLPLPYLDLISDIEFGKTIMPSVASFLPEEKKISSETQTAIKTIRTKVKLAKEEIVMNPSLLPLESAGGTGGESSILYKIISEYFIPGLYYKAETQLRNYLKIKHSKEVEARSYFYLGQIFYFKGAYMDAFLSFIMAQDSYYTAVQPWMDACFDKFYLENE
ncbi:MAG: hypothetical protein JXJ04_09965 [Spirochaetales bacterium]|nr:hypothetical protein [Spirochaetales bacterium]